MKFHSEVIQLRIPTPERPHCAGRAGLRGGRGARKRELARSSLVCAARLSGCCTSGSCRNLGSHATLVELEQLVNLVDTAQLSVADFNCFGLCGRGPNVSIDWDDGSTEMVTGVRTTAQSLDVIHKASGLRPAATAPLLARLEGLRHVSRMEQQLAKAQEIVDVLDVSSVERRASEASQSKYASALALVDAVLSEAAATDNAHPRPLAAAVRRQVIASRACRPISPEVEDVVVDDPDTWPET